MDAYTVLRKIAPAMYGGVLLARENATGQQVVIKKVNKKNARRKIKEYMEPIPGRSEMVPVAYTIKEDVLFELKTLKRLQSHRHPHLAQLKTHFEDRDFLFMVLEYIGGGELFDVIASEGRLHAATARRYAAQIAAALQFMHSHRVCHRDVSLENLLLTVDRNGSKDIVLIDYGLGADVNEKDGYTNGVCGKGFYIAPEVKAAHSDLVTYDGKRADAWSTGVCLFMMLFGCPPVEKPCPDDARFKQIARGELREMVASWGMASVVPEEALQVVERLLVVDPNKRATVEEILQMKWLKAEAEEVGARRQNRKKEGHRKGQAKAAQEIASVSFQFMLTTATRRVLQRTMKIPHQHPPRICSLRDSENHSAPTP